MNAILKSAIERVHPGPIKHWHNVAFAPLLVDDDRGPEFLTLSEALAAGSLTVSEISAGGSVPDLVVINKGDAPVLLLDGEELIGAKQNRSVNASILLAPHSGTRISVSCTERGRWATREDGLSFLRSDNIMERSVRHSKLRHTSHSLADMHAYASPATQHAVWEGIDQLSERVATSSPTDAMRDVFEAHGDRLRTALAELAPAPGQCGSVFFLADRVAGCDLLCRRGAYAGLHEKLVRSYALDADGPTGGPRQVPSIEAAAQFLSVLGEAASSQYKSVGLGHDLRLTGKAMIGSALVFDDTVIHLAAFAEDTPGDGVRPTGRMAGFRSRRANRLA